MHGFPDNALRLVHELPERDRGLTASYQELEQN
jgi:hypothetical protein